MKYFNLFLLFFFSIHLISCGSSSDDEYYENELLSDGTHCAEVTYSNPNTGTTNTYTLTVDVYNKELERINWPSGGWLDDDHFSTPTFDDNGFTSFTSDKGYEYEVQLIEGDCISDAEQMDEEVQEDAESMLCERCGEEKDSEFDDYCYWCQRKIEEEEEEANEDDNYSSGTGLENAKKELQTLLDARNNGEIVFRGSLAAEDDNNNTQIQHIIVVRRKINYLIAIQGSKSCPMGTIEFNPALTSVQTGIVTDYSIPKQKLFYQLKVLDYGKSLEEYRNYIIKSS